MRESLVVCALQIFYLSRNLIQRDKITSYAKQFEFFLRLIEFSSLKKAEEHTGWRMNFATLRNSNNFFLSVWNSFLFFLF